MNKRGLSLIITTLILIVLVLVAIGIIWFVVRNIISEKSEDIALGKFLVDTDIKGINIDESTNTISLLVRRNPGIGNITGFKFIFKNETDAEIHTWNTIMKELEERIFTFTLSMNVSQVLSINVIPLVKSGDKEILGVGEVYKVKVLAEIEIPSDEGNGNGGTVPGNNISYGSEYVFNAEYTYGVPVSALNSNSFVIGYNDNQINATAIIGTVSGDNISYSDEYVFNLGSTSFISISILNPTSFVVAYRDNSNAYYGTAVIGTILGNTISYSEEYVFNLGTTNSISISILNSTSFVIAYKDNSNSNYGTAVIGTILGNTISYSGEYVLSQGHK